MRPTRLEASVFRPADFIANTGLRAAIAGEQPRGYDRDAYHYPLMRTLAAARAHDLQAIDGLPQVRDVDWLAQATLLDETLPADQLERFLFERRGDL